MFGGQRHDEILIAFGGGGDCDLVRLVLGRAAWEACSATWILGTDSAFAAGPRKTRNTFVEFAGRRAFPVQPGLISFYNLDGVCLSY